MKYFKRNTFKNFIREKIGFFKKKKKILFPLKDV